jgi:hypothetical protein
MRRLLKELPSSISRVMVMGRVAVESAAVEHGASRDPQFALTKFRPPALPRHAGHKIRVH